MRLSKQFLMLAFISAFAVASVLAQSALTGWSPTPLVASNSQIETAAAAISPLGSDKALLGWVGYSSGNYDHFTRAMTAYSGEFEAIQNVGSTGNDEIYPALGAAGTQPYAAWVERSLYSGQGRIMFARAASGVWQSPRAVTSFMNRTTELNLVTSGSRLLLVWCDAHAGAPNLYRASSNDAGSTWTTPVAITTGIQNWYPSVAFDGTRVCLTWETWTTGHGEIAYSESSDLGQTWSATTTLSTADDLASERPGVCIVGGQPRVVWQEEQGTGRYALQWLARSAGNLWSGQRITAPASDARRPRAFAQGNAVWVTYQSPDTVGSADAPRLLASTNGGQNWFEPALISENATAGGRQAVMATQSAGYMAWIDEANTPAVLRVRTNPPMHTAITPQRWQALP